MKNWIKVVLILVILAVVSGIFYYKRNQLAPEPSATPTPTTATSTPTSSPVSISDLIQVTKPLANDLIDPTKPITIEGKARGNWYFEASFPVKLMDAYGNSLSQDAIQASGDWMTTDFVPFSKELNFGSPTTMTGTLILQNDNPSGDPANSKKLEIPIRFNIPSTSVKAYFGNSEKNPNAADCGLVYAVSRTVPKTAEVARASLMELLKGPTADEKTAGYYSSINLGVQIKSLTITNGVAKVDFDKTLEQNVGGSCRVSAIRAEITQTLIQFSTVKSVVISIDGRTEDILQP